MVARASRTEIVHEPQKFVGPCVCDGFQHVAFCRTIGFPDGSQRKATKSHCVSREGEGGRQALGGMMAKGGPLPPLLAPGVLRCVRSCARAAGAGSLRDCGLQASRRRCLLASPQWRAFLCCSWGLPAPGYKAPPISWCAHLFSTLSAAPPFRRSPCLLLCAPPATGGGRADV